MPRADIQSDYTLYRSKPLSLPSSPRTSPTRYTPSISHPTIQLPLTPPPTPPTKPLDNFYSSFSPQRKMPSLSPPGLDDRSDTSSEEGCETPRTLSTPTVSVIPDSPTYEYAERGRQGKPIYHRHTYQKTTPSLPSHSTFGASGVNGSDYNLPQLSLSDDEESPVGSTGILTPPVFDHDNNNGSSSSSSAYPRIAGNVYDLDPLNTSFEDGDLFERRGSGSKSTPYQKKNWGELLLNRELSPPTTPKGHPIAKNQSYFQKTLYPISRPPTVNSYISKLRVFAQIPRRYRPVLLLGLCLFTFITVYFVQASQIASKIDFLESRRSFASKTRVWGIPDAYRTGSVQQKRQKVKMPELPAIEFQSKEEEFTALLGFITSSASNTLPSIDPSQVLDPQLVLDFDPTSPHAKEDLELLKTEIQTLYPMVLFGKMRDPWHREIKKMLSEYKITPTPLIVDVDQRKDTNVFTPLIARILGTNELPLVYLNGKSLGSYHDVLNLREKGELKTVLTEGGMLVKDAKKKKKGMRERERFENELVLGPKPIVDA